MEEYKRIFKLVIEEEEWHKGHKLSEDKKLELSLGPPGEFLVFKNINGGERAVDDQEIRILEEGNWFSNNNNDEKQCKKEIIPQPLINNNSSSSSSSSSYLQCSRSVVDLGKKKSCSGAVNASFPATAMAGNSGPHKRVAAAPIVGWPPIRSFRKNIGSSSNSKQEPDNLQNKTPTEGCPGKKPDSFRNDLFVKINMEGVPIGRKINLNAYDSYEKLSVAIYELFRGLLAAQRETCAAMDANECDEKKASAGTGEYTLVYEDSEGDRILVGDVPWHMFVSTAKRLRVLKSSELSSP